MDELRDLVPRKDPKGGSPKTPYPIPTGPGPRKTPRPIPVSEFDEYRESNDVFGKFDTREVFVWVFRGLIVIAFLWMKATFVTNEKYDSDKGKTLTELQTISTTLARIDEKLTKGVETDLDHEKRLREIEHGKLQPK